MVFFDIFFGGVGDVFERGFLHSFKLKNTLKRAVMEREEGEGARREREGTGVTEQGMMGKLARRRLGSRGKGWREGGSEERGWA